VLTTSGTTVLAQNVSTNSVTCPTLQSGVTYLWSVSASNSAGSSPTSTPVYFTVSVTTAPPTPTGLSPGGASPPGTTVTTLTPTLTWNVSTGATAYSVAVLTTSGTTVLAQNVSTNSVTCPTLQSGVTYLWSVAASNSAGNSPTSAPVYFTVSVTTAPPTPTGLSPGGASPPGTTVNTLTPTLTWNVSTGATAYSVAVLTTSGTTVLAQNVSTNSVTCPTLQSGVTYLWSVSASNSAGSSPTSTPVYFTVSVASAPVLTGISISPSTVPAGQNATVTLTLSGPAPPTGAVIGLSTSNTAFPLPPSYTIPSGQSSTNFTEQASAVITATTSTMVTASYNGGSQNTSILVTLFYIGEYVTVYNTGGEGLNLRTCASTSCATIIDMPDGTVMQVIAEPTQAGGYTWWNLSGYVEGTVYSGWAVETYLEQ
jgi:serine protease